MSNPTSMTPDEILARLKTPIKMDPYNRGVEERIAGRPHSERRDCVVRAFAIATGKPYPVMHAMFKAAGRRDGKGTPRSISRAVAKKLGMRWIEERRTVARFLDDMIFARPVAAFISGHAFAVEKGAVVDIEAVRPRQIVKGYYTL